MFLAETPRWEVLLRHRGLQGFGAHNVSQDQMPLEHRLAALAVAMQGSLTQSPKLGIGPQAGISWIPWACATLTHGGVTRFARTTAGQGVAKRSGGQWCPYGNGLHQCCRCNGRNSVSQCPHNALQIPAWVTRGESEGKGKEKCKKGRGQKGWGKGRA